MSAPLRRTRRTLVVQRSHSGRSMIAHWTHCSVSRCYRPASFIVVNVNVQRSSIVCSWVKLMFDHRITQTIRWTVTVNDNASSFIVLHLRLNDERALWWMTCMLNVLLTFNCKPLRCSFMTVKTPLRGVFQYPPAQRWEVLGGLRPAETCPKYLSITNGTKRRFIAINRHILPPGRPPMGVPPHTMGGYPPTGVGQNTRKKAKKAAF